MPPPLPSLPTIVGQPPRLPPQAERLLRQAERLPYNGRRMRSSAGSCSYAGVTKPSHLVLRRLGFNLSTHPGHPPLYPVPLLPKPPIQHPQILLQHQRLLAKHHRPSSQHQRPLAKPSRPSVQPPPTASQHHRSAIPQARPPTFSACCGETCSSFLSVFICSVARRIGISPSTRPKTSL